MDKSISIHTKYYNRTRQGRGRNGTAHELLQHLVVLVEVRLEIRLAADVIAGAQNPEAEATRHLALPYKCPARTTRACYRVRWLIT
jgi:hypothetical protein